MTTPVADLHTPAHQHPDHLLIMHSPTSTSTPPHDPDLGPDRSPDRRRPGSLGRPDPPWRGSGADPPLIIRSTLNACHDPRVGPASRNRDDAIRHAYDQAIAWVELGDDPPRYLLAGPDTAGNPLELVLLVLTDAVLVIHAMKLRPSSAAEMFGGGQP